jgi:hypothetical protein
VSTSKLLIGILLTAFAFGATTVSAYARSHGGDRSAASEAKSEFARGGIPACGNGTVARYHTVSGVKHWHCV